MYRFLSDERLSGVADFPSKSVWRKFIPSKVNAFMWEVVHKRILTLDKLQRRGVLLANRCSLCTKDEENVDHLFIKCEFVKEIWGEAGKIFPYLIPPQGDILSTIRSWSCESPDNISDWIGFCALHAICW
ncbi:unnamed protein product [Linum trigynum]|uniref:Reverse transcriptase zinc-binding domain-containing protein n=1 Tax=Linum trigynum TaxID=586398 RepID=A0AAV2CTE2_9ROSI